MCKASEEEGVEEVGGGEGGIRVKERARGHGRDRPCVVRCGSPPAAITGTSHPRQWPRTAVSRNEAPDTAHYFIRTYPFHPIHACVIIGRYIEPCDDRARVGQSKVHSEEHKRVLCPVSYILDKA